MTEFYNTYIDSDDVKQAMELEKLQGGKPRNGGDREIYRAQRDYRTKRPGFDFENRVQPERSRSVRQAIEVSRMGKH